MRTEIRATDARARLVLPKAFANSTVIIEELSETELRVRRVKAVTESDAPFIEGSKSPLSDRDRDRFLDLLANPLEPNAALKKAAARRKARRG